MGSLQTLLLSELVESTALPLDRFDEPEENSVREDEAEYELNLAFLKACSPWRLAAATRAREECTGATCQPQLDVSSAVGDLPRCMWLPCMGECVTPVWMHGCDGSAGATLFAPVVVPLYDEPTSAAAPHCIVLGNPIQNSEEAAAGHAANSDTDIVDIASGADGGCSLPPAASSVPNPSAQLGNVKMGTLRPAGEGQGCRRAHSLHSAVGCDDACGLHPVDGFDGLSHFGEHELAPSCDRDLEFKSGPGPAPPIDNGNSNNPVHEEDLVGSDNNPVHEEVLVTACPSVDFLLPSVPAWPFPCDGCAEGECMKAPLVSFGVDEPAENANSVACSVTPLVHADEHVLDAEGDVSVACKLTTSRKKQKRRKKKTHGVASGAGEGECASGVMDALDDLKLGSLLEDTECQANKILGLAKNIGCKDCMRELIGIKVKMQQAHVLSAEEKHSCVTLSNGIIKSVLEVLEAAQLGSSISVQRGRHYICKGRTDHNYSYKHADSSATVLKSAAFATAPPAIESDVASSGHSDDALCCGHSSAVGLAVEHST